MQTEPLLEADILQLEAAFYRHYLGVYFEQQLEAVFHQVDLTCWPRSVAVLELHWKAERLEAG